VVDLLRQHHREGRRFEPVEFIEEGGRVAVGMDVRDRRWGDEVASGVFKVFAFREPGGKAVLLQDCAGRDDALAYLTGA
jgi:hypothetical protein